MAHEEYVLQPLAAFASFMQLDWMYADCFMKYVEMRVM